MARFTAEVSFMMSESFSTGYDFLCLSYLRACSDLLYGNVPEETEYFIHRLHGSWFYFVVFLPFLNFLLPFFVLIVKGVKMDSFYYLPLSVIVLVAQWLLYVLLLVVPELNPNPEAAAYWSSAWLDLGGACFGCRSLFRKLF